MRHLIALGLIGLLALEAGAGEAPKAPAGDAEVENPPAAPAAPVAFDDLAWVNVTANVGGEKWGYAGVCTIASVPGADEVIAGVSESGLWSSTDGGASWTPLGADGPARITHRPYVIVFDPKDPKTFWVSGSYGPGLFRTADGGKTFERLGMLNHTDGVAVDFTDPERKTLLAGLHEKPQSIVCSSDGGKTWRSIGKNLPAKTNHTANVLALDSKTFLTSAAGWAKGLAFGIFRTEDAGKTWTQVSDAGAAGQPLAASDGALYWGILWSRGLLKSTDQGKTWTPVEGPVKRTPFEAPGGRLVAVVDDRLHYSTDSGATWKPFGPAAPFKPDAAAYHEKRNCFYVSRTTEKKTDLAIARLDLPQPLAVCMARKLVVWDGEAATKGKAWVNPEGTVTFEPQTGAAHSGASALRLLAKGKGWAAAGWNWHSWWPKDAGTDLTAFRNLVFWVKFGGDKPPAGAGLVVSLASSDEGGKATGQVDVLKRCPDLFDGAWHEVVVPLEDLYAAAKEKGFNPKKAWQFDLGSWREAEGEFAVVVDDIGFDDRPAAPAKP